MSVDCGVIAHPAACLCDVEVESPSPINFSLTQVLGSEFMTNERWSYPWDATKFADYAETLLSAYDEWRHRQTKTWLHGHAARERTVDREELRSRIRELTTAGESMVDVPALLDMHPDEMWSVLQGGPRSPFREWGDLDWLRWESILRQHPRGASGYALALDWFGEPAPAKNAAQAFARLAAELYGFNVKKRVAKPRRS